MISGGVRVGVDINRGVEFVRKSAVNIRQGFLESQAYRLFQAEISGGRPKTF